MISEQFVEAYATIAQINRQRLHELAAILTEFESSGIEVLLLKGMDLLGRAYGGVLGLRPMGDVDLLFRREDLPQIERILEANGFRPRLSGNPSYVSPTHLELDMISGIWYLEDINAIWKRAVPRHVTGAIRPAMHPEDALIYLVAYQTIHRGRLGPQMALDVAALLDAEERFIDWNHVVHAINTCRLRLPLFHGLSYARDKGGAKIPAWVLDTLRPPPSRISHLYQRLVTERGIPELGYFLLVFSRPGCKNKLQALWNAVFPPRDFLAFRYGKRNPWDRLRVRLSRPAHLAFRGGLLLFRMGSRLLLPSVEGKAPLRPGAAERPLPTQKP